MNYTEKDIWVEGEYNLSAVITVPDDISKKYPAVVIVPSVGKIDKDGNARGFTTNLYKNLASFFAEQGVVTIRYDKRGVGKSSGKYLDTSLKNSVDDVLAVVDYLRNKPYIDKRKVILCGHGEGALLGEILIKNKNVKGLILLAGAGTSLKSVLHYQNEAIANQSLDMKGIRGSVIRRANDEDKGFFKIEELFEKALNTRKDKFWADGRLINAKWLGSHALIKDERILESLKSAKVPVFAATGSKDTMADPLIIKKIIDLKNKKITAVVIEDMDLLLKNCPGAPTLIMASKTVKESINKPIMKELKELISKWLDDNFKETQN